MRSACEQVHVPAVAEALSLFGALVVPSNQFF